ncbi:MAG: rubredoxin [Desulfurococcaceae archaeon]
MPFWKCQICGYVFEGPQPPDKCPKCGAPKEQFKQLSEKEAELITRSRRSNYLHMKALTLLRELLNVAEEIAQDNLDPACVKIADEEKEFATVAIQKIMAELEAHLKKGKWG